MDRNLTKRPKFGHRTDKFQINSEIFNFLNFMVTKKDFKIIIKGYYKNTFSLLCLE